MTTPSFDCIVLGSCVLDMICRPVDLDQPIGRGVLHQVEPLQLTAGGIVSNTGITMARLGMKAGAFSYVGKDAWGPVIRSLYQQQGLDDSLLLEHPTQATSTTVVMNDPSGERSFLHCVGAPKLLNRQVIESRLDCIGQSRMFLMGYYSLMPNLEPDLPELLQKIRQTGCQTAVDAAGDGGGMEPLGRMLPHLDVYVPSLGEAVHQTGHNDPRRIIDEYRKCGAPGLLGVKLGKQGALLSPKAGEYLDVPVCTPPGDVLDTTGAGDSFYAGLLTGLLKGLPIEQAGRLGCAAGACCITAVGGWAGARDYATTASVAGIA